MLTIHIYIYSSELKMDYVLLIYLNEFVSQISTFHTLLFFDNDTQGMMVWRILFIFLMICKKNFPSPIMIHSSFNNKTWL